MAQNLYVEIEKLVQGGAGLARLAPDASGRREAVFVPFTLPGERVRVELAPRRRGRVEARLVEVLEASPERIAPGCEYFGRCGGCQLQHTSAENQLRLKRAMLLETLRRTGGIDWTGEVQVHAGEAWGYRNRIRVQAVAGVGVGYYEAAGRHSLALPGASPPPPPVGRRPLAAPGPAERRVLPITHCPIASPGLNAGLAELAAAMPEEREEIELAVNNRDEGLRGDEALEFEVGGRRYQVGPEAFFQVNRFLAGELVETVTGGESGEAALDLYSGVGLFALPLTERFARVEAVEAHAAAARDLRHNLRGTAAEVAAVTAVEYLRQRTGGAVDLVVADPPRAGLGAEVTAELVALGAARLHLVSCDAATLGRDLRGLIAGGYEIRELHLIDLFPQTAQVEAVVKVGRG